MKPGWITMPLGQLAELRGRIGWKGLTAKEYTSTGPLFLSVHSLNYGDYVDYRDAFHISQERYDESPEIMLEANDILICKDGAGIGKLGIVKEVTEPTTINSSLLLIRPSEKIIPKFLYFCLKSPYFQEIVRSRLEGSTTPHLYQRDITTFPVVVPPLEEQQRTVATLDEVFERLDRARANAEANRKSAGELFTERLNLIFSDCGQDWESESIGNICVLRSGTTVDKSLELTDGDIPYVKVAEMNLPENIDGIQSSIRFLDSKYVSKNQIIPKGATIFPKRGGAILTNKKRRVLVDICADLNIMSVIPSDVIDNEFLYYFFLSVDMRELGSGASIPQINNYDIAPLKISYPKSLEAQKEVAKDLKELQEKCDELADGYRQQIKDLDDLRQSLLQNAFAGELT